MAEASSIRTMRVERICIVNFVNRCVKFHTEAKKDQGEFSIYFGEDASPKEAYRKRPLTQHPSLVRKSAQSASRPVIGSQVDQPKKER